MQRIVPTLWFEREAEDAARFYTSVFDEAEIVTISRYGEGAPLPAGTVLTVKLRLFGQEFLLLNGGPHVAFNEAISLLVNCETQEEIDRLWSQLTEGGTPQPCGWLRDRFGVSWQIIPAVLGELISDPDPVKSQSVMQALLAMGKIDIAGLREAYEHAAVTG